MAYGPRRSAPDLVGLDDAALAAALVGQAAARAARMRAEGVSARTKENLADLVTEADVAAERLVVDALTRLRPEDGVVGEEGTTRPSRSGRTWVIDPVDGTYNFATGTLYWCSALALRDADGVLVGAVEHRGAGESWLAVRGAGTFERGVAVPPLEDAPLSAVCLATYLHPARIADPSIREPWLAATRGAATMRMLGSGSCELAAVAAGRIGAWAQPDVLEWDWLPGKALVEGAGGSTDVVDVAGHPWHLAGTPSAVADLRRALEAG